MPKPAPWPTSPGSVFFDDAASPTRLSRAVQAGLLRRVARGIYTADPLRAPDELVRRNRWAIVARFFPDAVVADRSATRPAGATNDVVFVVSNTRKTDLVVPGLVVSPRRGPGPLPDDNVWSTGLHISSQARTLVDNLAPSRSRSNRPSRTLSRAELEDWVVSLVQTWGEARLNEIRDRAKAIALEFDETERVDAIDAIIGAALGTHETRRDASSLLRARRARRDWDATRVQQFEALASDLVVDDSPPPNPLIPPNEEATSTLPFYEAYFSNFIEGTEFTLDEATRIVRGGDISDRPEDAHDILGTFRIVADPFERAHAPESVDDFLETLKRWNAGIMAARPDKLPGTWKRTNNQAGSYQFVDHELVEGTLRAGYGFLDDIPGPLQRALFAMFVVSEVHPFEDGNGRVARSIMNTYLSADEHPRILIPIVYRNEYLTALRQLSRERRTGLFVATMTRAQQWTAAIAWDDNATVRLQFDRTHALVDSTDAESMGVQLQLPSEIA